MAESRVPISAFVVCCNEEHQIRRCLESLSFCDEIIVIDSGSTDRTIEICQQYTTKIVHQAWQGFVSQKRFGLSLCTHPWVLNIDADEEVSPELREQILNAVSPSSSTSGVCGYELSRVVWHLGRWWRKGGWYPEYRLRLLKREHASWGGEDPHERAIIAGPLQRLSGELRHYTYDDLADQIKSLNSHSSSAARSLVRRQEGWLIPKMLFNPIVRFIKFYILKRGFLEGLPGLIVGVLEGAYVFLKYAKAWELRTLKRE